LPSYKSILIISVFDSNQEDIFHSLSNDADKHKVRFRVVMVITLWMRKHTESPWLLFSLAIWFL